MGTFIAALARHEREVERQGPTVTVSGPAASGKSTAAKAVARRLGLGLVSMGTVFRELAEEEGAPLDEFMARSTPELHERADARQLEHAMRGGVVLEGRLGGWVAGDHAQVRVWLTAPIEERGRRAAGREGLSVEEGTELVRRRDEVDVETYRRVYGIDFSSLAPYNFVVSNHLYSARETADVLTYLLRKAAPRLPATVRLK